MGKGKRIAALTMARNDGFFLSRWLRYYAGELGAENLFVLLDGLDQELPDAERYPGVNVTSLPHPSLPRAKGDKYRIAQLNALAAKLLSDEGYDIAIGTDCDEFIVVDPLLDQPLADYLSTTAFPIGLSPLGIDLGQRLPQEPTLAPGRSILAQRRYGVLSPRYTKASIKATPTPWGSGFHRFRQHGYTIAANLYLIHTGNCDLELLETKMRDGARLEGGWQGHLARRAKTIHATTKRTPRPADELVSAARRAFQRTHLPWSPNKPSYFGPPLVVELPQRFERITI